MDGKLLALGSNQISGGWPSEYSPSNSYSLPSGMLQNRFVAGYTVIGGLDLHVQRVVSKVFETAVNAATSSAKYRCTPGY